MKNYVLSSSSLRYTDGSSDGTQIKFCENGKWFKQDLRGYEGEVEYIVSCLLKDYHAIVLFCLKSKTAPDFGCHNMKQKINLFYSVVFHGNNVATVICFFNHTFLCEKVIISKQKCCFFSLLFYIN